MIKDARYWTRELIYKTLGLVMCTLAVSVLMYNMISCTASIITKV